MKKRTQVIASLLCSTSIFVMEIVAMVSCIRRDGWNLFQYYTQDSNIFLLMSVLPWLFFVLRYLRDGVAIPTWARVVKYMATCTVSVTFVVVVSVLAPTMESYTALLFSNELLFTHTLCPLLAVISLLLFEGEPPLRRIHTWMALVPTALYAAVSVALNVVGVWYGPYPFLHVYEQPVWLSAVWCVTIVGGAGVLAWLLRIVNGALHREYVY